MTAILGKERTCPTVGRLAHAKAPAGMDATNPIERSESGAFWRS